VSPKFVAAAVLKVKNPIFLECIKIGSSGSVDMSLVKNTVDDFHKQIIDYAIGERKDSLHKTAKRHFLWGNALKKSTPGLKSIIKTKRIEVLPCMV